MNQLILYIGVKEKRKRKKQKYSGRDASRDVNTLDCVAPVFIFSQYFLPVVILQLKTTKDLYIFKDISVLIIDQQSCLHNNHI